MLQAAPVGCTHGGPAGYTDGKEMGHIRGGPRGTEGPGRMDEAPPGPEESCTRAGSPALKRLGLGRGRATTRTPVASTARGAYACRIGAGPVKAAAQTTGQRAHPRWAQSQPRQIVSESLSLALMLLRAWQHRPPRRPRLGGGPSLTRPPRQPGGERSSAPFSSTARPLAARPPRPPLNMGSGDHAIAGY